MLKSYAKKGSFLFSMHSRKQKRKKTKTISRRRTTITRGGSSKGEREREREREREMVSTHAFSSFSLSKYIPHDQEQKGLLLRNQNKVKIYSNSRFSRTQRRGLYTTPFRVKVNLSYNIPEECYYKHLFQSHRQSVPALANNSTKLLISKQCSTTRCSSSILEHEYASNPEEDDSRALQTGLSKQLHAFYKFSRPHTVIGTVVGIISVSLLPIETMAELTPTFLAGVLKALLPAILMNIYVVGLNQLYDVEIDKVNKPDLPLASGEFSMGMGVAIVSTFSLISFVMGLKFQSPPLLYALIISFLLGSVYSIEFPLLRWKRNAFLAATCILSVRALVVQLAFFVHMQKYVLGKPIIATRSLVFATAFMCFFSAVIALFKDIPDVDGDRDFGIQSFSVRLGQERVFWLCVNMLLTAYGAAVMVGATSSSILSKIVTVLGHCTLASILWVRAGSVNLSSKEAITSFYMFIWKLFYMEYLLIPFVR